MTPEERAKEETWLRKHLDDEEPGGLMAIGPRILDAMFPHPDTSGMTPEQAEAARAERDSRVRAFLAAAGGPMPSSIPPPPPQQSASPEVPVS
jgi:hypothetical protein